MKRQPTAEPDGTGFDVVNRLNAEREESARSRAEASARYRALTPPAAEEHALVELPEGWEWGEDEDGFCAHNGPHNYVWVADGTLRHTGAFVPIAVVLAVISRNAKVTT